MPAIDPAIVEKCILEYTGPLRFISYNNYLSSRTGLSWLGLILFLALSVNGFRHHFFVRNKHPIYRNL
jgi:hypothetical protein